MVKNTWIGLVAPLLALSLAGSAFAGEGKAAGAGTEPAKPAAPAERSGMAKEAKGKVISVNPGTKTLVVEAEGKRMTFAVAESAARALGTIKGGDQVTVRYTEEGGKFMAQDITKG
jgi:Cu/Ag efflux protein CusF